MRAVYKLSAENAEKRLAFPLFRCYHHTVNKLFFGRTGFDPFFFRVWAQSEPVRRITVSSALPAGLLRGQRMTRKENYESRSEKLLLPIMEECGFELVDVAYVKEGGTWYLRAYIDKPGGITINDCETVSRQFGELLDQEDFIEDSYVLEVSSPGLGRPLKKEKDFERSLGEKIEIRLYKALDGAKEYTGVLEAYDKDTVTIRTEDDADMTIEREKIALVRLAFDF